MLNYLLRPVTLLFISIYVGFIYWLLSGIKEENVKDFPWGRSYIEVSNGELSGLGEASYHFYSEKNSYIDYKNFDHFKEGFYMKLTDGTVPNEVKFKDFKYNKFSRTLTAICDFQSNDMDYINVFFDHYIYKNNHGFSRASGYQLDVGSYNQFLPFTFPNGANLVIEACSNNQKNDVPTNIFIRFEKDQYPNNEPSYETQTISLTSEMNTYRVAIPQTPPGVGYSSVLMYIENVNTSLIIKDLILEYNN